MRRSHRFLGITRVPADMQADGLKRLAALIPPASRDAIKSDPSVMSLIIKTVGISSSDNYKDLDANFVTEISESLPCLGEQEFITFVVLLFALSLSNEFKATCLSTLSAICRKDKLSSVTNSGLIFHFLSNDAFTKRSDGLVYSLCARSLPIIENFLFSKVLFIIDGLEHDDAYIRKQTLYILRQLISSERAGEGTVLYCPKEGKEQWREQWKSFFLLYDTFQEPQSHLLEALFLLLLGFLSSDDANEESSHSGVHLGFIWWECCVRRAFDNSSASVRKKMLEHIISDLPADKLRVVMKADEFILGSFLELADSSHLYSAIDFNRLVSPFGLLVTEFFKDFLSFHTGAEKEVRIRRFIIRLEKLTSNLTIMFLLKSLIDIPDKVKGLICEEHLKIFISLAGHRGFHNTKARSILCWQLSSILIDFCDPSGVEFSLLSECLSVLLGEIDRNSINPDWLDLLCAWLTKEEWLADKLMVSLVHFFDFGSKEMSVICVQAKFVSVMAALLIRSGFPGSDFGVIILRQLSASYHMDPLNMCRVISIIRSLEEQLSLLAGNNIRFLHGLATSSKLFEIFDQLNTILLPESKIRQFDIDVLSVKLFLDGVSMVASELIEIDDPLVQRQIVEYMDIQLFRSIEQLEGLSTADNNHAKDQFSKAAICGLISIILSSFVSMGYAGKIPLDARTMKIVLDLQLRRPQAADSSALELWPRLTELLNGYKWESICAFCRYSVLIKGDPVDNVGAFINLAIERLPFSAHMSAVSIINSVKTLLQLTSSLSESKEELNEIVARISLAFVRFLESMSEEKTKWYNVYATSIISCLFQESLVTIPELHSPRDGPLFNTFAYILNEIGPIRKGIVPHLLIHMYPAMKSNILVRKAYIYIIPDILMYGQVRNIPEERVAELIKNGGPQAKN